MNIDIGSCFNFGIERLKQNPFFYLMGTLILAGVSLAINLIAQALSFCFGLIVGFVGTKFGFGTLLLQVISGFGGAFIGLVVGICIAPFLVGYVRGIKKEYDGGTAGIGDIFNGFDVFVPSLANYALANLAVIAGILCCIIPGILLSPLIPLSVFFIVKGQTTGIDAFKKSFETLKAAPIIILWTIVLNLFGIIGIIACLVGIFVTIPISVCAMFKLCQQATGEDRPLSQPVVQA